MRDTSGIGEVTKAQMVAALVARGKQVLLPFGDSRRYDLVMEEADGRFLRVQCKTGRLINGAVVFPTSSIHAPSRTGLAKTMRRPYRGEVDLFGVYCPANGKAYLVPIDDVCDGAGWLRVDPPRNGQQRNIRWASQYEIGTAVEIGGCQDLAVTEGFD